MKKYQVDSGLFPAFFVLYDLFADLLAGVRSFMIPYTAIKPAIPSEK